PGARRARFSGSGELVLLRDQDRRLWNRSAIAAAVVTLTRAAALRPPGRYQLRAAIAACHAEAPSWDDTDWPQIVTLYDMLLHVAPSPVARLNRAVSLRYVAGPELALGEVQQLGSDLHGYYLFHAAYADLLQELGHREQARA